MEDADSDGIAGLLTLSGDGDPEGFVMGKLVSNTDSWFRCEGEWESVVVEASSNGLTVGRLGQRAGT